MGDFNCYLEDNLFNIIREEETNNTCFNVCYDNIKNNILGTFHYFKGGYEGKIIDYILYSKEYEIKSLNIDDRKIDGGYPSDHYPVICIFVVCCLINLIRYNINGLKTNCKL